MHTARLSHRPELLRVSRAQPSGPKRLSAIRRELGTGQSTCQFGRRALHLMAFVAVITLCAATLTGCPNDPSQSTCKEDPCPWGMSCDDASEQCRAPNRVKARSISSRPAIVTNADGVVYISAYDTEGRDLVLGVWDRVDGRLNYQTVDSNRDVGLYSAIDLYSDGRPAIAYRDSSLARLMFAYMDEGGQWRTEVIDDTADVGVDLDLTIDSEDVPHVSYRDRTYQVLRYALRSQEIWRFDFVDTGADPPSQIPVEEACPEEQRSRVNRGVGYQSHLVVSGATPVVSYYDADCGTLRLARKSGGSWVLRVIDGASDPLPSQNAGTRVGHYNDIAIDAKGDPVVAFFDGGEGTLKIARSLDGVPLIELIDDGRRRDETGERKIIVGQFPSIAFDTDGSAVISHINGATLGLLLSTRSPTGWKTSSLDIEPGVIATALAIGSDGTRHVVTQEIGGEHTLVRLDHISRN